MDKHKKLSYDEALCINCTGCEVSCKRQNDVPVIPPELGLPVKRIESTIFDPGTPDESFYLMYCRHCMHPSCMYACPTSAIYKESHIVLIDESRCIGCKLCIDACPYGALNRGYNVETETVEKCTLCKDRLEAGLKPACATFCATSALKFAEGMMR